MKPSEASVGLRAALLLLPVLFCAACPADLDPCPVDVVLGTADIPCACGGSRVDSLPGHSECICLESGRVDCEHEGDSAAW
jgi:hypothetical protein